jgi:hypothetical protein
MQGFLTWCRHVWLTNRSLPFRGKYIRFLCYLPAQIRFYYARSLCTERTQHVNFWQATPLPFHLAFYPNKTLLILTHHLHVLKTFYWNFAVDVAKELPAEEANTTPSSC